VHHAAALVSTLPPESRVAYLANSRNEQTKTRKTESKYCSVTPEQYLRLFPDRIEGGG
jgi:hypothetical protein